MRDLEAAASAHMPSAMVLSDLSAAYLVRAVANQDPRDLVRALGRAISAQERDPLLPEAAFNKALALEQLGITSTVAWWDYLRLDGASPWAEEARRHLTELGAAAIESRWRPARSLLAEAAQRNSLTTIETVVARFPRSARLHVEEDLLPAWGAAWRAGRVGESDSLLTAARYISEALAKLGGDMLLADSVHHLDSLLRAGKTDRLASLAEGLAVYGEAVQLRREERIVAADERFDLAGRSLARAGSPFAAWPALQRAICAYTLQDYSQALRRLDVLLEQPGRSRYLNLAGRAWWVVGLSRVALAQPAEAISSYRRSLTEFRLSGEEESAIAVQGLLADVLRYIGEEREGWRYRYAALVGSYKLQDPRRRLVVLGETAQAALQLGEADSALLFLKEALRLVARTGNPLDLAEGLRARAAIELQLHREREAVMSLRLARQQLERLHEPSLADAVQGEILEVEGKLLASQDPAQALATFGAAADLFRRTSFLSRLADCYLDEARIQLAAGRRDEAKRGLYAAIAIVEEEWRRTITHRGEPVVSEFGPGYTERRRNIFDALLTVLSQERDAAAAFDLAERSHGWDLLAEALELPSGNIGSPALQASEPLGRAQLQQRLPPGVALIEYALLPDRLIAWAVTRERLHMVVTPVGEAAVSRKVERFFSALRASDRQGLRTSLEDLHNLLLRPVRSILSGSRQLVIVPDRCLGAVPFSALRDPITGRRVIADASVTVSPSAHLFIGALDRRRALASQRHSGVLVVGNPEFDRTVFRMSPPLPGAAEETVQLEALYPGALILSGREATKQRFLELAPRHAVVHFGGHALSRSGPALVSSLLLAPSAEAGDAGALYAYEFLRRRFDYTRLFVLSACDTAGGGSRRIGGFVRPLLAAGVPSIVASLWAVEDRSTAGFMAAFHSQYRETGDAPSALRAAQLAAIAKSADDELEISLWGAFEAFGASSLPARASATLRNLP